MSVFILPAAQLLSFFWAIYVGLAGANKHEYDVAWIWLVLIVIIRCIMNINTVTP